MPYKTDNPEEPFREEKSKMNIVYDQNGQEVDEDGYSVDNMQVQAPLLSAVPVMNLNLEKTEINFASEVKADNNENTANAIKEQFTGLQMDQLIGEPLRAVADASTLLADSTADFINRVGFDEAGKVRIATFSHREHSANEDGTSNMEEMKVDVPMLAIAPIPKLQVDEVNVLFDMEVKNSESSESSKDINRSLSGSPNMGMAKVNITGSISTHQENTRNSDNSAKYRVGVHVTNHDIPEYLARVKAENLETAMGQVAENWNTFLSQAEDGDEYEDNR